MVCRERPLSDTGHRPCSSGSSRSAQEHESGHESRSRWALFLLLASGFGVQYVEFAAPLLCYVNLVEGFWWGWTSGLFIGAVYWIFGTWHPFQSVFAARYPGPAPLLGMLAWAVLAHFVWVHVRSRPASQIGG